MNLSPIPPEPILHGWLQNARKVPSPNQDSRPGSEISLLVIHCISLPPGHFGGDAIERLFCNRLVPEEHPFYREITGLKVSAHVLIDRQGRITQFVPFHRRAWHAGVSSFQEREKCNDFSIGIELEGTESTPYTEDQYLCLARITAVLLGTYPELTKERIVAHSDIAPGRKTDPGPSFDWARYHQLLNGF